jgi:iron complex outermembrane recepter protein
MRVGLSAGRICGLLVFTALTPASAFAQEASAAANTGTGNTGTQLQEIIVTAQRREQRVQNVPIAISAFSGQALRASGIANVGALAQADPSLNIPQNVGIYLPFLRGIGNSAAGDIGNESSVPVYIDDVYYTRLSTAYLALGDINQVEVLKGPQGTLFGRNSSGGAIQMFTRDPGRTTEVDATIGYANYDTASGQLYASTPIADNLGWNIALGGSDQQSGWGRSLTTGQQVDRQKSATIRSKLIWEPTSDTRIKIVGFYAYTDGDIGIPENVHSGTYGGSGELPFPGYPNPPVALPSLGDNPATFYDTRNNFIPTAREHGFGGSIRIDQKTAFADLVSITAFRNSKGLISQDGDLTAQNLESADLYDTDDQITQELQIKSKNGSSINWILGGFFLHSGSGYQPASVSGDLLTVAIAPGAVENVYSHQTINSYSAYGQMTAPIFDKTNLTIGLRFTNDNVSGTGITMAYIPGVGNTPVSADYSDSRNFKRLTWKGALDHHFSDDLMAYASVSRGYKAGTFNSLPLDGPPALPETVDAYEVGLKTEVLDRRLRVNGAVFWNDIGNPQVLTVITQGLTSGIGLTNAQKARVKGGEIGFDAVAAKGLKLRGAATYLDGKYVRFTNAPFYSENGTTLVGPTVGNASGNRLPNVAKWRFDVGMNYALNAGGGEWIADVGASYTGRFAWTPDNTIFEKPVTLLNASLNFTPTALHAVTFGVWGRNIGNIKYYSSTQESVVPLGTGGYQSSAAAPRTFGGTISVKY